MNVEKVLSSTVDATPGEIRPAGIRDMISEQMDRIQELNNKPIPKEKTEITKNVEILEKKVEVIIDSFEEVTNMLIEYIDEKERRDQIRDKTERRASWVNQGGRRNGCRRKGNRKWR